MTTQTLEIPAFLNKQILRGFTYHADDIKQKLACGHFILGEHARETGFCFIGHSRNWAVSWEIKCGYCQTLLMTLKRRKNGYLYDGDVRLDARTLLLDERLRKGTSGEWQEKTEERKEGCYRHPLSF